VLVFRAVAYLNINKFTSNFLNYFLEFQEQISFYTSVSFTPSDTRSADDVTVVVSKNLAEATDAEDVYEKSDVPVLNFEDYVRLRKEQIQGFDKEYEVSDFLLPRPCSKE